MHDNPQTANGGFFALPGHRLIQFAGPDAAAFAQSQFINDVKALAVRQWHWSGWLTPKGRVIALFALLKHDEGNLWLLLPDADPVSLADALRRFVFRSKVTIAVRDDWRVMGQFGVPVEARGNAFSVDGEDAVTLDMSGDGGVRCLRIAAEASAGDDPEASARWALSDLEHGLPRLPASQVEQWTPQQLSLERLRGFSVKKGCYPGQEIVARTHFLGKAKRGLAAFEADVSPGVGAQVHGDDAVLGTVIATAGYAGRHVALAVLPLEREAAAWHAGGVAVCPRPLLGNLAR